MFSETMIVLYLILYNIPFSILRYYPFLNKLRISVQQLCGIYAILLVTQIITFFYLYKNDFANLQASQDFRIRFAVIYLLFSLVVIKANVFKQLFVYLMMFTYSAIVCDTAYIVEALAAHYFETPTYFITNIVILLELVITYPFVFHFIKNKFIPILKMKYDDVWKYIWIIPVIFIIFASLFGVGLGKETLMNWRHYLVRLLVGLSFFSIYFILIKIMKQTTQNATLHENIRMTKKLLTAQSSQYKILTDNIDKAKAARHDVRHHIVVLQSYLKSKQFSLMEEYLNQYEVRLTESEQPILCKHYIVDAILQYYRAIAEPLEIRFTIYVVMPEKVAINDLDMCIILGNIIENAIEACERTTHTGQFINLNIKIIGNMLVITMDNSYDGIVKAAGNLFISSKNSKSKEGVGLSSVKAIVDKYNGVFALEALQDRFKTSIMLNLIAMKPTSAQNHLSDA